MLYLVSHSDYDEYTPYIVEGPEVPDWKAYCDTLLPDACFNAVNDRRITGQFQGQQYGWIGWREVVEALVGVLETKGYTRLRPIEARYSGPGIINDHTDINMFPDENDHHYGIVNNRSQEMIIAADQIIAFNRRTRDDMGFSESPELKYNPEEGF